MIQKVFLLLRLENFIKLLLNLLSMGIITINLKDRSYDIKISKGNLFQTDFRIFGGSRYAIITDTKVSEVYGVSLENLLKKQGLPVELIKFPAGESSKTPEMAIKIGRDLARSRFDRDSIIIALGGGIVGDLAGYVASSYERGLGVFKFPQLFLLK